MAVCVNVSVDVQIIDSVFFIDILCGYYLLISLQVYCNCANTGNNIDIRRVVEPRRPKIDKRSAGFLCGR